MKSRERTARGVGLAIALAFTVLGCVQGTAHDGNGGSSGGGTGGSGTAGSNGAGTGGSNGTAGSNGSGGTANGSGGTTTSSGGHTGSGGAISGSGGATGSGGHIANLDGGTRPDLTGKKALLIVSSTSSPDDGEVLLQELLQLRGMDVTLGDESSPASMATGFAMVVLSSNVTNAVPVFAPVPVPVIVFGNTSFYQPMGFITANAMRGSTSGSPQLNVMDTTTLLSSDLAQGATVDVFIAGVNSNYTWGTPGGAPIKVAAVAGTPTQVVSFAYEKGAAMATGTAAARRVSLGWKSGNIKSLAVDSFKLQDGAFSWAAGGM
jgi:hypothetical protein